MKLLFDMNFGPRWPDRVRPLGIEALHWGEVGAPTAADAEILEWAESEGCVVVTQDLGFSAILAKGRARRFGVVVVRRASGLEERLPDLLVRAVRAHESELTSGAVVSIDARTGRARVRSL